MLKMSYVNMIFTRFHVINSHFCRLPPLERDVFMDGP